MKNKHTHESGNAMIIGIIIIVIVGAGIIYLTMGSNTSTSERTEDVAGEDAMMEDGGAMMEGDAMTEDTDASGAMMTTDEEESAMMIQTDETQQVLAGSYEAYSPEKLARADRGDVVLFFHASWCPTCRASETSFNETGIPDGMNILKVNYDTATDLRKKYGVTTQHTYVQVDAEGNPVKKWVGSITAAEIQSKLL